MMEKSLNLRSWQYDFKGTPAAILAIKKSDPVRQALRRAYRL